MAIDCFRDAAALNLAWLEYEVTGTLIVALKLDGVIEFLDSAKADIVLLQEADLNARRTHHISIAIEITHEALTFNKQPIRNGNAGCQQIA